MDNVNPFTDIRRKDRAVQDDAWIKAMLRRIPAGVLATTCDGQPFLQPNLFVYHEARHVIYFHKARTGRTSTNLAINDRVCFNIFEMGQLLPSHLAHELSVEYASVNVFGRVSLVEDPDEAREALQLLIDRYFPHMQSGRDYAPMKAKEVAQPAVYCLHIDAWSGKKNESQ